MGIVALIDYHLVCDLVESVDTISMLDDILSTLALLRDFNTNLCYTDELYTQESSGQTFAAWLYDYNTQPELRDRKREFGIYIRKGQRVEQDEYYKKLNDINQHNLMNGLVLSIRFADSDPLYVSTPSRYWFARQWYLAKYVKESEFINEAFLSFPNIYFHENVTSSWHTLNAKFHIVGPIIVEHLQALDAFRGRFTMLSQQKIGYQQICHEFKTSYSVECSPQADRDSTKALRFDLWNTESNSYESLCCELHTKLRWPDMDRQNQDRIHFHPGKPNIEGGKVLVAHIGAHQ